MTIAEARELLENDPDLCGSHYMAISVLEEAAKLEERERCAKIAEGFFPDWRAPCKSVAISAAGATAETIAEYIRKGEK